MDAIEHLAETAWKTPDSYFGFSPVGDYCILSRHRDSDLLSESNWDVACKSLNAEAYDNSEYDSRPAVYTWSANHWAVGWCEYLMVRADAPEATLQEAGEIICALADYPVLSDDDWSRRQHEAQCEAWANASVRDRVEWMQRCFGMRCNIFAARRDELPECDNDSLRMALIGE